MILMFYVLKLSFWVKFGYQEGLHDMYKEFRRKTILSTRKKQKSKSYFIKKSKYNSSPTLIDQSLFVFLGEFK